jgi:hypothetical protein
MTSSMNGTASLRTTTDNDGQGILQLEFYIYDYLSVPYLTDGVGMIAMVRIYFAFQNNLHIAFLLFSSFTTIHKYHKLTSTALAWFPIVNIHCNFQRKQYHFLVRPILIALQQFEMI